MLANISGEYGIVSDPELSFAGNGGAKLKLRLISKKRKKDANGTWADAEPTFRNAVVWGKMAENLHESVNKGDSIILIGEDASYEYEKDGQRKAYDYIDVKAVGVSVRWQPTKGIVSEARAVVSEVLGAEDAPF